MSSCRIVIHDEVNFKVENLSVDVRRKIANKLKFQVPYARYLPQYKLGRWDGTVGFFGLGGSGYINHLDVVLKVLNEQGVEVAEIKDNRQTHNLKFSKIDENYFAARNWPKGHQENVDRLIEYLENRKNFNLTKMNWSTGIIIATKKH